MRAGKTQWDWKRYCAFFGIGGAVFCSATLMKECLFDREIVRLLKTETGLE